jgi:hypothetical protein
VQHHVDHVEPLRRPVHHEVPLRLQHPGAQHPVPPLGDLLEDGLELRYPRRRHGHRHLAPVQHVAERRRVPVGDDHGHATGEHGLHHPRARHLEAAGAEAEAGPGHARVVVLPRGEVLVDVHARVLPAEPVPQQRLADVPVHAAGEEGERRAVLGREPERGAAEDAVGEVHLRQRRVLARAEALRGVGVAQHPDRVPVELPVALGDQRCLHTHAIVRKNQLNDGDNRASRRRTYPVVARDDDVVGAAGPVPVGVLAGDDVDVVGEHAAHGLDVGRGVEPVDVVHEVADADGEEEGVGLTGVAGGEGVPGVLHLLQELPLDGVDVGARAEVRQRRLALPVRPDLELPLHLQVAPDRSSTFRDRVTRLFLHDMLLCIKKVSSTHALRSMHRRRILRDR